jgi:hypothetical protein
VPQSHNSEHSNSTYALANAVKVSFMFFICGCWWSLFCAITAIALAIAVSSEAGLLYACGTMKHSVYIKSQDCEETIIWDKPGHMAQHWVYTLNRIGSYMTITKSKVAIEQLQGFKCI